MKEIIKLYFNSWIYNDISILENIFTDNILYMESWGPAYKGIEQLKAWFREWHKDNKVLVWDIKDITIQNNKAICEWYFKFQHNEKIEDFNGVSIIYFDDNNKIIELKEYMSMLPIRYPYNKIDIRELKEENISKSLELIWNVFKEFEAPDYSEDGINEFKLFIDYNNIFNMYNSKKLKLWGAFDEEKLVGVIATRDISHICLFFVNKKYHKQGIGRRLFSRILEDIRDEGITKITVNSSPYAVDIYHHIGFVDTDIEQTINGIKFTPMKYIINIDI